MKREDFIKLLEKRDYSYIIENDWLIINHDGYVQLFNNNLTTLPNNIKFNNDGYVDLSDNNLTSLPDNIKFYNNGAVSLSNNNLTTLPNNIKFNNKGYVYLSYNNLTSLPDNIQFENKGGVSLYNNNLTKVIGGNSKREIIIFNTSRGYEIQLGCWRGNKLDTLKRIENEYGLNSDYYKKVKKAFEEKE